MSSQQQPQTTTTTIVDLESILPIQFRVLSIFSFAIIAWAIDLQLINWLRLDPTRSLILSQPNPHHHHHHHHHPSIPTTTSASTSSSVIGTTGSLSSSSATATTTATEPLSSSENFYLHPQTSHFQIYLAGLSLSIVTLVGLVTSRILIQSNLTSAYLAHSLSFLPGLVIIFYPLKLSPFYHQFRSGHRKLLSCLRRITSLKNFGRRAKGSLTSFSDVILADVLTSLSKSLGNLWVIVLRMFQINDRFTLIPLILTSLPFCIRFKQCLNDSIVGTENRRKSIMNSIKYLTSLPPIFLFSYVLRLNESLKFSNYSKPSVKGSSPSRSSESLFLEESVEVLKYYHYFLRLYITFSIVNSSFSFYWDIVNDWGLSLSSILPSSSPFGSKPSRNRHNQKRFKRKSLIFSRSSRSTKTDCDLDELIVNRPSSSATKNHHGGSHLNESYENGEEGGNDEEMRKLIQTSKQFNQKPSAESLRRRGRREDSRTRYFYLILSILNLILRFSWILNVYKLTNLRRNLKSTSSSTSGSFDGSEANDRRIDKNEFYEIGFSLEFFEVLRRFIWCLIRIEWEENCRIRKLEKGKRSELELYKNDDSEEEEEEDERQGEGEDDDDGYEDSDENYDDEEIKRRDDDGEGVGRRGKEVEIINQRQVKVYHHYINDQNLRHHNHHHNHHQSGSEVFLNENEEGFGGVGVGVGGCGSSSSDGGSTSRVLKEVVLPNSKDSNKFDHTFNNNNNFGGVYSQGYDKIFDLNEFNHEFMWIQ